LISSTIGDIKNGSADLDISSLIVIYRKPGNNCNIVVQGFSD